MGVAPHTLPGPVLQLKRRLCGAPVSSVLLLGAALTACVLVVGELGWGLRNLSTENLAFSSLRQALAPSRRAAAQAPKKALRSWDTLGLLGGDAAFESSVVNKGSLGRLARAIARANNERRPLRLGVLGGSFSAGGTVNDLRDSYPEVLVELLGGRGQPLQGGEWQDFEGVAKYGMELVNMAQGGAGFMLPMFCTEKVYSLVAPEPELRPDVWLVEFAENFDAGLTEYLVLLGMLLTDKEKFGEPAVITTAVAKNFCWLPPGGAERAGCGLLRTLPWLENAAASLDLPLISFAHGVAGAMKIPAFWLLDAGASRSDPSMDRLLDNARRVLYAEGGANQHFNEYGHHLFAALIHRAFVEAAKVAEAVQDEEDLDALEPFPVSELTSQLPSPAKDMLERLSSNSTGRTLQCNLTLTQGRGVDLLPVNTNGYELWSEKSQIFGDRMRSDRKQTWSPKREGATIDFAVAPAVNTSTLCLLTYGAHSMRLEASFHALNGKKGEYRSKRFSKAADRAAAEEVCTFEGGVDWTIYSVYKIDCSCRLPPRLANGQRHVVRLKSVVGTMQVAGVVLW